MIFTSTISLILALAPATIFAAPTRTIYPDSIANIFSRQAVPASVWEQLKKTDSLCDLSNVVLPVGTFLHANLTKSLLDQLLTYHSTNSPCRRYHRPHSPPHCHRPWHTKLHLRLLFCVRYSQGSRRRCIPLQRYLRCRAPQHQSPRRCDQARTQLRYSYRL